MRGFYHNYQTCHQTSVIRSPGCVSSVQKNCVYVCEVQIDDEPFLAGFYSDLFYFPVIFSVFGTFVKSDPECQCLGSFSGRISHRSHSRSSSDDSLDSVLRSACVCVWVRITYSRLWIIYTQTRVLWSHVVRTLLDCAAFRFNSNCDHIWKEMSKVVKHFLLSHPFKKGLTCLFPSHVFTSALIMLNTHFIIITTHVFHICVIFI